MSQPSEKDKRRAAQGRRLAVVIALAGILSVIAPWLVQVFGLPRRFEGLFYLISLAAFFWALVVAVQIWQTRD
ncbi:DUF5337 domain-containing protein [Alphaproteobacteria bacterium KMM 3653]|uniref:DUF5337 domain-containing protein n=1 Tax=Harenicola maris TaxID=2841044 RepID=A0AAP2G332_9RHOB|nr:DUF5337 domain-containing protein [Harenicola maris]